MQTLVQVLARITLGALHRPADRGLALGLAPLHRAGFVGMLLAFALTRIFVGPVLGEWVTAGEAAETVNR